MTEKQSKGLTSCDGCAGTLVFNCTHRKICGAGVFRPTKDCPGWRPVVTGVTPAPDPVKTIQIAAAPETKYSHGCLYALRDDDSIWEKHFGEVWIKLPAIPDEETK